MFLDQIGPKSPSAYVMQSSQLQWQRERRWVTAASVAMAAATRAVPMWQNDAFTLLSAWPIAQAGTFAGVHAACSYRTKPGNSKMLVKPNVWSRIRATVASPAFMVSALALLDASGRAYPAAFMDMRDPILLGLTAGLNLSYIASQDNVVDRTINQVWARLLERLHPVLASDEAKTAREKKQQAARGPATLQGSAPHARVAGRASPLVLRTQARAVFDMSVDAKEIRHCVHSHLENGHDRQILLQVLVEHLAKLRRDFTSGKKEEPQVVKVAELLIALEELPLQPHEVRAGLTRIAEKQSVAKSVERLKHRAKERPNGIVAAATAGSLFAEIARLTTTPV